MKSPKKKKEPEKQPESPAFFGKKKDDESFFQRKEDAGEKKEVEVKKEEEEDEEKKVQTKAEGTTGGHTTKASDNPGVKPGGAAGKSLPPSTQSQMESAFGTGFKDVNIHTDEEAAAKSRDLQAQAFTYGQDIYFNKGKFKPGTIEGDALLAHELAHTLQQKDETNVGQDFEEQAEQEADDAAIEYLQGRKVRNLSGAGKLKALKKSRGKGLRIQRCKDKPEKGPTPAPTPTPKDAGTPDPNEAMRNQVAGVRSLKVEEYKTRLAGEIGDLQLRFKKRKDHLDEKSPLVKGDQKT